MLRWRAGLLAVLLAAVAWGPFASAAPTNAIVVTSARSASVEFTLSKTASPTGEQPTITGGGRYAGIIIDALDGRQPGRPGTRMFAAVRLAPVSDHVHMFAFPDQMPAGRYRATVLAERPVQISIRLSGGSAGTALKATRPVLARFDMTTTARDAAAADGRTSVEARLRGVVPRDSEAVVVSQAEGQRVDSSRLCVAAPGRGCPSQLLPFGLPDPLGALEPDSGSLETRGSLRARNVAPAGAVRDAVASLEGVRNGRTALVLAALSFRRT